MLFACSVCDIAAAISVCGLWHNIVLPICRNPTAGRKYYIDVYAVNIATNASVSYVGATVKARRRKSSKLSGRLVDGKSTHIVLKTSRPEKTLQYRMTARSPVAVNIYLRSCEVPPPTAVRVQLRREGDGETLATSVVQTSFEKALSASSVQPGTYRISVSTADGATPPRGHRYRWTVLLSTADRSLYPTLPVDTRVRLVADVCRSTTVAWRLASAPGPQRYCVHVEPATSSAALNACASPRRRRKSVKVSCHVTGSENPSAVEERGNGTMTQTISGMKPGRRYAVDVYASKAIRTTKEFLVYERLIIDVPTTC